MLLAARGHLREHTVFFRACIDVDTLQIHIFLELWVFVELVRSCRG